MAVNGNKSYISSLLTTSFIFLVFTMYLLVLISALRIEKMHGELFPTEIIIISFLNFYLIDKLDSNIAHRYKPVTLI